jgi:hypothetical protein
LADTAARQGVRVETLFFDKGRIPALGHESPSHLR